MTKVLCGNEMDKMPAWAFRIMAFMFNIGDLFTPAGNKLKGFNIRPGDTVVDYGSGTGRYLRKASEMAGASGMVYAVDIHELAVESAFRRIRKYDLKNVHPVQSDGNSSSVPSDCADLIYALDMFHMVRNTFVFLKELNRIAKTGGTLIIEDGHQPRTLSREKIMKSGLWEIREEAKTYLKCTPKK